ncbi:thylakoid membrane photosystem I accumulation factor [Chroococcidiopsis cubana]|uniref:thylakoid membrane photosystem I accumulation factor n=1 Tax=Chroococcidiopsis cubana TaxID=171392 RepID=UPI002ACEB142|nr:thylakoid membrane photosystem I accumulation factor [Chroococcidiopsis cubana]
MTKLLLLFVVFSYCLGIPSALAGINDDNYEGTFCVVWWKCLTSTTKTTLEKSMAASDRATLLVLYLDDCSDCKQYASAVSRMQAFYGRATDIIPVNVDTILPELTYKPTEPGYYYKGAVPQVIVFDKAGKVVLNETGQVPYERVDDTLREVFDLLPRTESSELKRRSFNEFSSEVTE